MVILTGPCAKCGIWILSASSCLSSTDAIAEASGVVQDVDRYLAEEFDIGVQAISRPLDSQRGTGEDGRIC